MSDSATFNEAGAMYAHEGGRNAREELARVFRAEHDEDKPLTVAKRSRLTKAFMRGYKRGVKEEQRNPARLLPVGRLVTVRAMRRKNGRVDIYPSR